MHFTEFAQQFAWILAPLGQSVTAVIMIRRKLVREVPWFFAYTAYQLLRFAALFSLYHYSYKYYFYAYWIAEGIDAFLVLAVIQEIYSHAFEGFDALRSLSAILFRWATIILFVLVILVAASASGSEQDRFIAGLLILDRSASFVQCGLIFLLVILKGTIGLPWRNPSRGIALGLGIVSASVAVNLTIRAYSHQSLDVWFGLILTFTYDFAVLIWIAAVLRLEISPADEAALTTERLRQWDSALLQLTRK